MKTPTAIADEAVAGAMRHASPRAHWSKAQTNLLIEHYPDTPMKRLTELLGRDKNSIYYKAHSLGLKRSAAYLASEHACRLRRGDNPGAAHRFSKGQTPWNAGIKGWKAGGNSVKTQFKEGQNPHNWNPIGHERLTKDGYLQRKMTDTKCTRKDYRFVHHMLWEAVNGPVPPGHALAFKDGNKANITIDNLELLTRAELCRRNSIHRYPPELKDLIRLQKKLERTIRKRDDEKQND